MKNSKESFTCRALMILCQAPVLYNVRTFRKQKREKGTKRKPTEKEEDQKEKHN